MIQPNVRKGFHILKSKIHVIAEHDLVYVKFHGAYNQNVVDKTLETFLSHPSYHCDMNGIGDFTEVNLSDFGFAKATFGAMRLLRDINRIGHGSTYFIVDDGVPTLLAQMFLQTISALQTTKDKKHSWGSLSNVEEALAALGLDNSALETHCDVITIDEQSIAPNEP